MEHLFERPSLYHTILTLEHDQLESLGNLVIMKMRVKDPDFMKPIYFLLRKGYSPNTYITRKTKKFIPTATRFDEMFVSEETKKHCFDFVIDMFEEYQDFEENALLYFHACGVDLDLPCEQEEKSKTLREKIRTKWDEFEDFENVESYSFSYILNALDIMFPNRYGIDLEDKELLVKELSSTDQSQCIQMYSNSFVQDYTLEQAVKAYNLELVKKNTDIHVDKKLVQFLISNLKNKCAQECLILLCNRDITLSVFDIQHLPQAKKEELLKIYKTPMYISNPEYKKQMFPKYFHKNEVEEEFIQKIINQDKLIDELIQNYRENNKRVILTSNTNFYDLYQKKIPTLVNETDLIGESCFDFPLQSIFTSRTDDLIYIFTPNDYDSIVQSKKNPYTNTEMPSIPEIEKTISISDFLEEMRNGKKLHSENVNQTNHIQTQVIIYDLDASDVGTGINPFQILLNSISSFTFSNLDENFEQ